MKNEKKVLIAVWVDPKLKNRIQEHCDSEYITESGFLRKLLDQFFKTKK